MIHRCWPSFVAWPVSLDGVACSPPDPRDVIQRYSCIKRLYLQKCQGKHNNVFLTTMVDIAQQLYIQL